MEREALLSFERKTLESQIPEQFLQRSNQLSGQPARLEPSLAAFPAGDGMSYEQWLLTGAAEPRAIANEQSGRFALAARDLRWCTETGRFVPAPGFAASSRCCLLSGWLAETGRFAEGLPQPYHAYERLFHSLVQIPAQFLASTAL